MTEKGYTTQLAAGLGLIQETGMLLDLWQEGMSATDLYREALSSGLFSNLSARRLHDMIAVSFAQRYLRNQGVQAKFLKGIKTNLSKNEFEQLLFLNTCRANPILADFVRQVYWDAYAAGSQTLTNEEARNFVTEAIREGKTTMAWSKTMMRRVASYLTGCCADFGLLESGAKSVRTILPFRIEPRVTAILAYELHFDGLGDNVMLAHPNWALFGLERNDVLDDLKRLALKGLLIVQAAGGVIRISWQYKSMKELTDVLIDGEL